MLINSDLTTIHVYYYMPDYTHITQLFAWQTMDIAPRFPRIHKFLDYWHHNIEAVIAEIHLAHVAMTHNKFVNGKEILNLK